jgi:hypothetical protein
MSNARLESLLRAVGTRHVLGALGFGLVAIGISHRLAFVVTASGAVLLLAGLGLLLIALVLPNERVGSEVVGNVVFTGLFVFLAAISALAPYRQDAMASLFTLLAGAVFVIFEIWSPLRRTRLFVVLGLILASHAVVVMLLPFPKQDAFRVITYAADGLFRHGVDPYGPIPDSVSADVAPYTLGYPPGAVLLVAPFRLFLGDIRWAYVFAEGVFVLAGAHAARRLGARSTWREALLLTPLVLPRTSQAFFDYGNHDWVLLGLTAAVVAFRSRPAMCGVLLGLGITAKQYFIVFPVLFLLPWLAPAALVVAAATALAVTVPFLAWDPLGLVRGVTAQFTAHMDPDRLTLYGMLRTAGHAPSLASQDAALGLSGIGLLAGIACSLLRRRRVGLAVAASGMGFAIFTVLAKTAAYNYYAYALALIALGMAVSDVDQREEPGGVPGVLGVAREVRAKDLLLHPRPE